MAIIHPVLGLGSLASLSRPSDWHHANRTTLTNTPIAVRLVESTLRADYDIYLYFRGR